MYWRIWRGSVIGGLVSGVVPRITKGFTKPLSIGQICGNPPMVSILPRAFLPRQAFVDGNGRAGAIDSGEQGLLGTGFGVASGVKAGDGGLQAGIDPHRAPASETGTQVSRVRWCWGACKNSAARSSARPSANSTQCSPSPAEPMSRATGSSQMSIFWRRKRRRALGVRLPGPSVTTTTSALQRLTNRARLVTVRPRPYTTSGWPRTSQPWQYGQCSPPPRPHSSRKPGRGGKISDTPVASSIRRAVMVVGTSSTMPWPVARKPRPYRASKSIWKY